MDLNNGQMAIKQGVIKQGILWQQNDKLFSKWKQRYFILTRDHLCCLRKGDNGFACGETIFKVKLENIKSIELITRIMQQTIELTLDGEHQGSRILLKSNADLREWFDVLNACCNISKQRKNPHSGYIEAVKARGRNFRREKSEISQSSSQSDRSTFINLSDHMPRFSFRLHSNSLTLRARSNSASPYGPLSDMDNTNGFAMRRPGGSLRSRLRNYDRIYRNPHESWPGDEETTHELTENVCYRMKQLQT